MADVEMNKGVQILLERMSSNPDEFIPDLRNGYPPKWRDILMGVQMRASRDKDYADQLPFLNDREIKALWEKMQSLQGDLFTKRVMNTLLRESAEDRQFFKLSHNKYSTINVPPNGGTVTIYPPTTIVPPPTTAELSLLFRQVASGSPKGSF
jgi:hypothetical protein